MTASTGPKEAESTAKCRVVLCPRLVERGVHYCDYHWTIEEPRALAQKRGWDVRAGAQPAYGHFGGGCYS